MHKSKDEITLGELIIAIYKFFANYWLILLIFSLLGIAYGYYRAKKIKVIPYYKTSALVSTGIVYRLSSYNDMPNIYPLYSVLKEIETSFADSNLNYLKSVFNVDVHKIKSFEVELGEYRYYSPTEVIINIEVYDPSVLSDISENLEKYCNSNAYLQKYIQGQQEFADYVQQQLAQQDSVVRVKEKQVNLTDISYIPGVYNNKMQYMHFIMHSHFDKPYILVKDFDYKPSPIIHKVSVKKKVIINFLMFLFLGFVVAFGIETIKFIRNELKK